MSAVDLPAGPADRTAWPSARSIRRYAAAVARRRTGAGVGAVLGDVYYAAVMVGIAVLLGYGALGQLPVSEPTSGGLIGSRGTSVDALVLVVLLAVVGTVLSLAGRLGPVGVGGAESTWWLPLPVERRGLLRGAVWTLPVLTAVGSAVVVGVLVAGASARGDVVGGRGAAEGVVAALVAAPLGALLVVLAGLAQQGVGSRPTLFAGDLLLGAAPLAGVVAVLAGWRPTGIGAVPWWLLGAGLVALAGASVLLDTRLGRIPARALREGGAVAAHATGALVSLDTRELGRALTDRVGRQERRHSLRMGLVRGPRSALVVSDLLVLTRSPRHLIQVLGAAAVPWVVVATPELAGRTQVTIAVLVSGYVATIATAEGARRAEMAPILDRLLPLSAKAVRTTRLAVPAGAMTLWTLVAFGAVAAWLDDPTWLLLALLAGPAWAGAALRSAYRPAPDWSGPLVSSPLGALPTGAAGVVARGPDAVLGLLPAMIALLVGSVPPVLLGVQALTTVAVLAWGTSLQTRSMMDRLSDAASAGEKGPR